MKLPVIIFAIAGTTILAAPVEVPLAAVGNPVEIKSSSFQFTEAPISAPRSDGDDLEKRSAPAGNYYMPPNNPVSYRPPADTSSFLPESQYRDAMLRVHNNCRSAHGVPLLKWSQDLVNYGQSNTPTCAFAHTRTLGMDGVGENILYGPGSPESMVQTMWYDNELRLYNFGRQGFSMSTGHMTQMVWKATTEVGCAVKRCPQGTFVKCNYRRPGNVMGQFEGNVPAPKTAVKSDPPASNYNNYNTPAPKNNYNSPAPNNGYYQTNSGYYQTNNGYYSTQNSGRVRGGSTPKPNNDNAQNRKPTTYTYTYTYGRQRSSNKQNSKPSTSSTQNRHTSNGCRCAQSKPASQSYGSYYVKRFLESTGIKRATCC